MGFHMGFCSGFLWEARKVLHVEGLGSPSYWLQNQKARVFDTKKPSKSSELAIEQHIIPLPPRDTLQHCFTGPLQP